MNDKRLSSGRKPLLDRIRAFLRSERGRPEHHPRRIQKKREFNEIRPFIIDLRVVEPRSPRAPVARHVVRPGAENGSARENVQDIHRGKFCGFFVFRLNERLSFRAEQRIVHPLLRLAGSVGGFPFFHMNMVVMHVLQTHCGESIRHRISGLRTPVRLTVAAAARLQNRSVASSAARRLTKINPDCPVIRFVLLRNGRKVFRRNDSGSLELQQIIMIVPVRPDFPVENVIEISLVLRRDPVEPLSLTQPFVTAECKEDAVVALSGHSALRHLPFRNREIFIIAFDSKFCGREAECVRILEIIPEMNLRALLARSRLQFQSLVPSRKIIPERRNRDGIISPQTAHSKPHIVDDRKVVESDFRRIVEHVLESALKNRRRRNHAVVARLLRFP